MTEDLRSKDDWDSLSKDQWDQLIDLQYLEDEEIEGIFDERKSKQTPLDPEFTKFIDSLAPEEVAEFTPEEIKQMFEEKTPSEFKLILDKMEDFNEIVHVFQLFNDS